MNLDFWTCAELFTRLDDYLDRELAPEEMEKVAEHLRMCDHCAEVFEFEGGVLAAVKARVRLSEAPEGLMDRIRSKLREE